MHCSRTHKPWSGTHTRFSGTHSYVSRSSFPQADLGNCSVDPDHQSRFPQLCWSKVAGSGHPYYFRNRNWETTSPTLSYNCSSYNDFNSGTAPVRTHRALLDIICAVPVFFVSRELQLCSFCLSLSSSLWCQTSPDRCSECFSHVLAQLGVACAAMSGMEFPAVYFCVHK